MNKMVVLSYQTPLRYIPNALTITRILLTPLFLCLLLSKESGYKAWALMVLAIAALTDWLDGRIARSYNCKTRLGQFLDPLADKVLMLGTFIALAVLLPNAILWWAVALIGIRDITTTSLRIWLEAKGRPLAVIQAARVKTFMQALFIVTVLCLLALGETSGSLGEYTRVALESPLLPITLTLIALFTAYTGALYLLRQWRMQ